MDKLELDLDDLEVQSFEPGASSEEEAEGTIFGQEYDLDTIDIPCETDCIGGYYCPVNQE